MLGLVSWWRSWLALGGRLLWVNWGACCAEHGDRLLKPVFVFDSVVLLLPGLFLDTMDKVEDKPHLPGRTADLFSLSCLP